LPVAILEIVQHHTVFMRNLGVGQRGNVIYQADRACLGCAAGLPAKVKRA